MRCALPIVLGLVCLLAAAPSLSHAAPTDSAPPPSTPLDLFSPQVHVGDDAARGSGSDEAMGGVARRSTISDSGAMSSELKQLALASGRSEYKKLIISTLDGALHCVDRWDGTLLWTLQSPKPLLSSPSRSVPGSDAFIMPGIDGSLYSYNEESATFGPLDITIQEMADGYLNIGGVSYLGSKKVEMIVLDLETGKVLVASDQGSGAGYVSPDFNDHADDCPPFDGQSVITITKTDYTVQAFHGSNYLDSWNASVSVYSSFDEYPRSDDPPFVYTHPNGHVYVTDPSVDLMFVKWNQHFGSPVSSVYGVDASHKVSLVQHYYMPPPQQKEFKWRGSKALQPVAQGYAPQSEDELSLYFVGYAHDQLFVVPNVPVKADSQHGTDTSVSTCVQGMSQFPDCLTGFHVSFSTRPKVIGSNDDQSLRMLPGPSPVGPETLAHHLMHTHDLQPIEDPEMLPYWFPYALAIFLGVILVVHEHYGPKDEAKKNKAQANGKPAPASSQQPEPSNPQPKPSSPDTLDLDKNSADSPKITQLNQKLSFDPNELLGTGSHGTVVFSGTFASRPVAVKRLVKQFYDNAKKEIDFLISADHHPNVLRYYAEEEDDNFLYIALELCHCSLADLIASDAGGNSSEGLYLHPPSEGSNIPYSPVMRARRSRPRSDSWESLLSNLIGMEELKESHPSHPAYSESKSSSPDSHSTSTSSSTTSGTYFPPPGLSKPPPGLPLVGSRAPPASPPKNPSDREHRKAVYARRYVINDKTVKLMYDVFSGIRHLHELNIVHRDVKPQNILISRTNRVKLADMGLSKRLDGNRSSFYSLPVGSCGWQAPEVLNEAQRLTKGVDAFSLGCVLYFVLTQGWHPYGDRVHRDANIKTGKPDTSLMSHHPEAKELIDSLIAPEAENRPPISDAMEHPFFWNDEKKLQFLGDCSDRVEVEQPEHYIRVLLETRFAEVVPSGDWSKSIDQVILDDLGKYRKYNFGSLRDALRVIRNKYSHYAALPPPVKKVFGSIPSGYLNYFMWRFPQLLIEMYAYFGALCAHEPVFRKYYENVSHKTRKQQWNRVLSKARRAAPTVRLREFTEDDFAAPVPAEVAAATPGVSDGKAPDDADAANTAAAAAPGQPPYIVALHDLAREIWTPRRRPRNNNLREPPSRFGGRSTSPHSGGRGGGSGRRKRPTSTKKKNGPGSALANLLKDAVGEANASCAPVAAPPKPQEPPASAS